MKIRPIQKSDNPKIARVIRDVMIEHRIDKPGSVFTDPTTDRLYELFGKERSAYWIVELNGQIVGGCGIYPTAGLPSGCVELVKLYLLKETRGTGLGKKLMLKCIEQAAELGYTQVYLESMPELNSAIGLYEKLNFKPLDGPLGNSGHYACDVWMIRDI